ncbi:dTDP-4-dehydrorhamnose reductase [Peteryoungia aggregata LMG 23059]|uniref:dTDP-4-dehydrorhamnose reductase n=1 Tax=Peteryoungia aggregata LMG 23059 TaxID=1368425 RepID=A0ABU0GD42_9HYPH|nr:dTDP-4-dehydrorhamnose reductase [Peteryoungia aggregata]MDQ0423272.1 dTDP-4-dehydrorhamnose reductase [Peteryoungia aggregata LMG 23059]
MKILLLGRDGQVGFELRRALAPLGDVVAVGRLTCDFENEEDIKRTINAVGPDVIVNAAAFTKVDLAERETQRAYAINSEAVSLIGREAAQIGALVVHYSTDYVFDGLSTEAYRENSAANPLGTYGKSKLEGERRLAESGAQHLIFRTSWVYGLHGGNFAKTILKLAREREELSVVSDQFGAPTSACLIADVTAHALVRTKARPSLQGLYHLTASGSTNWHAYACRLVEKARAAGLPLRVDVGGIRSVSSLEYATVARRPANSLLDTSKLCQAFQFRLPAWTDGVDYFLEQFIGDHVTA